MQADPLRSVRETVQLLTFDCYGTLVDWESGIRAAIRNATGHDDERVFDAYLRHEAAVERGPYQAYREVQARALQRAADECGITVPPDRQYALADTLGDWPLWHDTNQALLRLKQRYRLGVLSNIDGALFARTAAHMSVAFDLLVTAEDVRSYKPAHAHFHAMLNHVGGDTSKVLHVAQSLYHDHLPATALEIPSVWINRRGEHNATTGKPLAEFPDLAGFAHALLS